MFVRVSLLVVQTFDRVCGSFNWRQLLCFFVDSRAAAQCENVSKLADIVVGVPRLCFVSAKTTFLGGSKFSGDALLLMPPLLAAGLEVSLSAVGDMSPFRPVTSEETYIDARDVLR